MNDKQKRFCEEYVVTLNGAQSAINAGYSEKTARQKAYELLSQDDIQKRIQELQKEVSDRNKITVDECVSLLASMARFDIADLYDTAGNLKPIHDIPKDTRLVIESIDTDEITAEGAKIGEVKKLKLSNRRANIIELMKHLGGYNEDNKQKEVSINLISLGKGLNPE